MEVYIESVDGNQMAAKVTGRFSIGDDSFAFMAIAFGRIGGQNIGAKLDTDTMNLLKTRGHDPDKTLDELQRHLVHGNIHLPEGLQRESFADA